jgi:hypothetical protein
MAVALSLDTMTNTNSASNRSLAADFREMMAAWATIEAAAQREFPGACEDEIYQICRGAMNHALKLDSAP